MTASRLRLPGLFAALVITVVAPWLASCSKVAMLPIQPNERPTLVITQAPAVPTQPFFYAYEIRWAGFDTDGHIDHFLYAIDPPSSANAETVWVKTLENRQIFQFRSDHLDTLTDQTAIGYHTIVLKAVDDRDGMSAPEARSFTSFTIAPTVQITNPIPNHLLTPTFGPSFRVAWTGTDPDGRTTGKPVKYKYKLFYNGNTDFDFLTLLVRPDSLRRYYAPNFAGWDSVGGDTTSVDLRNLVPERNYVIVVIAIDEVGAYSPVLNFDVNMLYFGVSYAGLLGPRFTLYGDGFYYQFSGGGFSLDPSTFVRAEVPADRPLLFHWNASTTSGSFVQGYRWMIDGNVGDEAPRTDEATDIGRWSQWSPLSTAVNLAAVSPPPGRSIETHFLYVEARDNNQLLSLAVLQYTAVRPAFDRDLLFVDDTRLAPDKLVNGGIDRPRGVWPTAAELDTFMFARGGRPWKSYPTGTLSPVGIFQGYSYDTVGTRFLNNGEITLEQMGHYRHIVWYVDYKGSLNDLPPSYTRDPMPTLHWMSSPSHANPLATWVSQGGKLWFMGGGIASSLQREWEKSGSAGDVFSSTDGELVPGRMMYDMMGWRSEISAKSLAQLRFPERMPAPFPGSPDYTLLPPYLFEKSAETDPIAVYAPNRSGQSDFYQTAYTGEALTKPNDVVEDTDPDPNREVLGATLDTIYVTAGGALGADRPVMTLYHGPHLTPVLFSGFPLWFWRRADQITIADWVLQNYWGLSRQNVPRQNAPR